MFGRSPRIVKWVVAVLLLLGPSTTSAFVQRPSWRIQTSTCTLIKASTSTLQAKTVITWDEYMEMLVEYKKKYNTANVPHRDKDHPELGSFAKYVRRIQKRISPEKKAQLDEMGFIWNEVAKEKFDLRWQEMFQRLEAYKSAHGDCLVPTRYTEDAKLGHWVLRQRSRYKHGQITEDQEEKLTSIGFVWRLRHNNGGESPEQRMQWCIHFGELVEYYQRHGTFQISHGHSAEFLRRWVDRQRQQYRNGLMSEEREELLDDIGFTWSCRPAMEAKWHQQYEKVKDYYLKSRQDEDAGDRPVEDDDLVLSRSSDSWARRQVYLYERGSLDPERVAMLNEIGFDWKFDCKSSKRKRSSTWDKKWEARYQELIRFYKVNNHFVVPRTGKTKALSFWVANQRKNFKNNGIREYRKALLDDIGFPWFPKWLDNRHDPAPDKLEQVDVWEMQWQQRYEELAEFYRQHNHFKVPATGDTKSLAVWNKNQRHAYKKKKLRRDRLELLVKTGFFPCSHLDDYTEEAPSTMDKKWRQNFQELVHFYQQEKHFQVPRRGVTLSLGNWVSNQRILYSKGQLRKDRMELLDTIRFQWALNTIVDRG